MRILIVSEGFGRDLFGVSQVILKLNEWLPSLGVSCRVLVANLGDISNIEADVKKIPVDAFEHLLRWHPAMYGFFIKEMADYQPDIVHVHGIFTLVQRMAVQAAQALRIPILWSTHGGLEDWAWRQKGLFYNLGKRIYWRILLYPLYKKVDFIHVITDLESKSLTRQFPHLPQIQIPNGIDFADIPYRSDQLPERRFVFLGRLHPVKGVDLLIKAFSQARLDENWRLIVAGPDQDPIYGKQLRQMVMDLHLNRQVQFIGPSFGEEKYKLMAKAWAVVVPSYSEVVALVNLEAAAVFTPTITTHATGLHNWEQGGGLLVDSNEDQLAQALSRAASWSLDERLKNGERARQFVKEKYSWDVIGQKWLDAYQMIRKQS